MCHLTHGAAEGVVFPVVHRVLEEVSLADHVFTVVSIRLVIVEVDLPEKPGEELLELMS